MASICLGLNELIPTSMSNYINCEVCDEITYLRPNFNGAPMKFRKGEKISSRTLLY